MVWTMTHRVLGVGAIALVAALGGCAATSQTTLPLTPRLQWLANAGYCGETAVVTAALGLGEYVSQYEARSLASRLPQSDPASQLLPGVNAVVAARALRLTAADWTEGADPVALLAWTREQLRLGHPVVIGVYENGSAFGEGGDTEFDHVVLAIGTRGETLIIDDHGLWNPEDWSPADQTAAPPPYRFDIDPSVAILTRDQADAPGAPVYSLPAGVPLYATAITGIDDPTRVTVPVSLTTDVEYEWPAMADDSDAAPAATPITVTANIRDLTPGRRYVVYTYDRLEAVPTRDFNARAAQAATIETFLADAESRTLLPVTIASSDLIVYRVVPADAP